ncbi:MAG: hypothetical protein H7308_19870 [Chthonomonadaceae bacterium]|nr:hypothetical protein [Chthonomonadaceae bacterium]
MANDWRSAYFQQAKSDYSILLKLKEINDVPLCQKLHYLQMTTEKMSKSFLTPVGGDQHKQTHDALVRFLQSAKTRSDLRRECNFATAPTFVFVAYIQALSPTAQAIENLSPEGASHPNPEYPWKTGGKIITPFEHDFSDLKLSNPSCYPAVASERSIR